MSNGLNTDFTRDPVAFMDDPIHWDINSTGINGINRPIYNLDVNNVGEFDLVRIGGNSLRLQDYSSASGWSLAFFEKSIKAYYLNSTPNGQSTINVLRHADYFFTDTITGCSFLAEGLNRHSLLVTHVNSLARGAVPLRIAELQTRRSTLPLRFVYGAPEYRSGGFHIGEDPQNVVVTVFGVRLADGWHFYARRRINNPQSTGPRRVLGPVEEIHPL